MKYRETKCGIVSFPGAMLALGSLAKNKTAEVRITQEEGGGDEIFGKMRFSAEAKIFFMNWATGETHDDFHETVLD